MRYIEVTEPVTQFDRSPPVNLVADRNLPHRGKRKGLAPIYGGFPQVHPQGVQNHSQLTLHPFLSPAGWHNTKGTPTGETQGTVRNTEMNHLAAAENFAIPVDSQLTHPNQKCPRQMWFWHKPPCDGHPQKQDIIRMQGSGKPERQDPCNPCRLFHSPVEICHSVGPKPQMGESRK